MLSAAQISSYQDKGFLVLEGFKSLADCQSLMARSEALIQDFEPDHTTFFSTQDQSRAADDYFLSSGDKIRFFFEEEALSPTGELVVDKMRSINKLGHAMHELDPVFRAFSADKRLQDICAAIGLGDPRVLQSMYIFKQPYIGGEVLTHQDSTFLYTDPLSCVGFWFALEDATLENGCLWGLPGGHRQGLSRLMKRKADGCGVEFEEYQDIEAPEAELLALPVKAGSLIVFDGCFPHLSYANRSGKTRHAYTLHMISGAAHYPEFNWLQREDGSAFPALAELA